MKKGFKPYRLKPLTVLFPRFMEHLHQSLENLSSIYRLKGIIEEHERKWSGIIGNCIKWGENFPVFGYMAYCNCSFFVVLTLPYLTA